MDRTLTSEQKRIDFRPPEDLPAPLDRPTDACLFATNLLTATAKAVQQTLHGTNGFAFTSEVSLDIACLILIVQCTEALICGAASAHWLHAWLCSTLHMSVAC